MHKLGFFAKHWHESLELLMVLDGSIEITIDEDHYELKEEDKSKITAFNAILNPSYTVTC